jgi:putative endonuclease
VVDPRISAGTRRGSAGKGARGEQAACGYLHERGWTLLARNFRTPRAEIDIVARKSDLLAFIEVKTWDVLAKDSLEHAVGPRKRARILGAARIFLAGRPEISYRTLRFDVILINGGGRRIDHIEDAFCGVV